MTGLLTLSYVSLENAALSKDKDKHKEKQKRCKFKT